MEGYLAEIRMFGGNFAPRGWFFCQGQLLSIAQWTAVFALVGTTYGGDGQTTFGIPDFRGRRALGTGQGPGLSNVNLGEMAGTQSVTLLTTNLPAHNHTITGTVKAQAAADGSLGSDATNRRIGPGAFYSASTNELVNMAPMSGNLQLAPAGNNVPISTVSPYMAVNFIMCVEGIFPSRN